MSETMQRVATAFAAILAGLIVQNLGIDRHTADIFSTAVASAGIGWAVKHFSAWGTVEVSPTTPVVVVPIPTKPPPANGPPVS